MHAVFTFDALMLRSQDHSWPHSMLSGCEGAQPTHAQQIVSRTDEPGVELHPSDAAEHRLAQSAVALHPAEDLLHALAFLLAHRVARMARGTRIESRRASILDLGDVRGNVACSEESDKAFGVITLVSAERGGPNALLSLACEQLRRRLGLRFQRRAHPQIDAQPVPVFHERMPTEAQLRFLARALLQELRLRVSAGFMSGVAAPLAAEIHHALVVRVTTGRRLVLAPKALHRGPGFDQRAVHGEVLIGEQLLLTRLAHHRIEEAPRAIFLDQPLAKAAEVGLI